MSKFTSLELKLTNFQDSKQKARGTVVIGDSVKVHFAVYDGKNGVWAKLPSVKGKKVDPKTGFPPDFAQVSFVDKDDYGVFTELVRQEYRVLTGESQGSSRTMKQVSQERSYGDEDIPF